MGWVAGLRTIATMETMTAKTAAPTMRLVGLNQAARFEWRVEAGTSRWRLDLRLPSRARTFSAPADDISLSGGSLRLGVASGRLERVEPVEVGRAEERID